MDPPADLILSPVAIPTLTVAVVIVFLGVYVIGRERTSAVTVSFLVLTATVATWLVNVSLMYMSTRPGIALLWAKIAYVGICAIPVAVFQFTVALTNELRQRRGVLAASWLIAALFVVLFTASDKLLTGVWKYSWGYYPRLGPASAAFLLFFATLLTASLVVLRGALRAQPAEQQRKRIRSIFLALAVGYVGSLDYLPSFGIPIYPAGYLAITGFIILSMRTIRRFRLVDFSPSFVAERLFDAMQGGVIVIDTHGTIRLVNRVAASLLGYPTTKLTGSDLRSLLQSAELPATDSPTFAQRGRMRKRPMMWRRRDGSDIELSVSAEMLRDRDSLPVGILYVLHDLAERRRAEQHEFAANHDALTGLANRTFLQNRFDDVIEEVVSHNRIAALMFLDLDGFKEVNDRHGHAAGDAVLKVVASRLRDALREEDLIARYGGDEFVVLLSLGREADAHVAAQKISRALRDSITVGTTEIHVGLSIGIALYPRDGRDLGDLIQAADAEMYCAKRQGKLSTARRIG